MFTKDDLIDAIVRHLQAQAAGARPRLNPGSGTAFNSAELKAVPDPRFNLASPDKRRPAAPPPGPKGRRFVTELDIKKMLTAGQTRLTLPADAIISPLATDWLILKGITVVRQ